MNLLDLQRRMADDVRRPLTADYTMQRFHEDGGSMETLSASYIKPNAQLNSFERLEIYNRQYWFRVIGAVSEDFPALNALLGSEQFDTLVLAYLKDHPSTSWTLRDLGAKLPDFLNDHPEFAGRRHRLSVDVARLEWAYVEAFDSTRLNPLSPEQIAAIHPESKLSLQPHLQLLALSYPVDELVLAVRRQTPETEIVSSAAHERSAANRLTLPPMRLNKIHLVVHRFDDSVYYRRIGREQFLLLSALHHGQSLAQSLQSAFQASRLTMTARAQLVQECFAHAAELGWLCPANN